VTRLLLVEVGNTNTKLGAWDGHVVESTSLYPSREWLSAFEHASRLLAASPEEEFGVALASVVPEAEAAWVDWCQQRKLQVFVVRGDTPGPLTNRYRDPARLGPDRLCTAVGAAARFGTPVIVASLGTAVVVDAVSAAQEFLGGAIWVGVGTGLAALAERTAALPDVSIAPPTTPIGADTETGLRIGASYGTAGLIETLCVRMREFIGAEAPLVLTGGDAELVSSYLRIEHAVAPALSLEGLARIREHNRGRADANR
jgi:type III pantothenate kinase